MMLDRPCGQFQQLKISSISRKILPIPSVQLPTRVMKHLYFSHLHDVNLGIIFEKMETWSKSTENYEDAYHRFESNQFVRLRYYEMQ